MAAEEKTDKLLTISDIKMNWHKICNCIEHEMYPKVASAIRTLINKQNQNDPKKNDGETLIDQYDLSPKSESKLIESLKTKKKLAIEERTYLQGLIERARSFTPIQNNHQCMMLSRLSFRY